jgi:hypothetical protein
MFGLLIINLIMVLYDTYSIFFFYGFWPGTMSAQIAIRIMEGYITERVY